MVNEVYYIIFYPSNPKLCENCQYSHGDKVLEDPGECIQACLFNVSLWRRSYPVRTQRHFNVHTTSSRRYERCIDVEKTLYTTCSWRSRDSQTSAAHINIFVLSIFFNVLFITCWLSIQPKNIFTCPKWTIMSLKFRLLGMSSI